MPSRLTNRHRGAASSTAPDTRAHWTTSASGSAAATPARISLSVVACRRTVVKPAARSTCSSASEPRSESVMTTVGSVAIGYCLLRPGEPRIGDALRGLLHVLLHGPLGRPPVTRRDHVEQVLMGVRMAAY